MIRQRTQAREPWSEVPPRAGRWGILLVLSGLLGGLVACEQAPAEPTPSPSAARPVRTANSLSWTAPPTWNVERVANQGLYRAKYTVPMAGDAKHTAEVMVSRVDAARGGDLQETIAGFLGLFEGAGKTPPKPEQLEVGDFEVTWVEVAGTYRFPMGPPVGPKKQAAAHVLKKGWRGVVAGVKTKSRGSWFFRLVGPDDSVAAARSSFRTMIETLK